MRPCSASAGRPAALGVEPVRLVVEVDREIPGTSSAVLRVGDERPAGGEHSGVRGDPGGSGAHCRPVQRDLHAELAARATNCRSPRGCPAGSMLMAAVLRADRPRRADRAGGAPVAAGSAGCRPLRFDSPIGGSAAGRPRRSPRRSVQILGRRPTSLHRAAGSSRRRGPGEQLYQSRRRLAVSRLVGRPGEQLPIGRSVRIARPLGQRDASRSAAPRSVAQARRRTAAPLARSPGRRPRARSSAPGLQALTSSSASGRVDLAWMCVSQVFHGPPGSTRR